jgi:hypothetical protein
MSEEVIEILEYTRQVALGQLLLASLQNVSLRDRWSLFCPGMIGE